MSTITEFEDLTNLDAGTAVRVVDEHRGNRQWIVTSDGMMTHDQISIPVAAFRAAVEAGKVETGPLFEVGAVFAHSRDGADLDEWRWQVTDIHENGSVADFVIYNQHRIYDFRNGMDSAPGGRPRLATLTPLDTLMASMCREMKNRLAAAGDWERHYRVSQREITRLRRAESSGNTGRVDINDLNSSIIEALEEFDDEDDRERIVQVLRQHGMEVPTREVDFRITVDVDLEGVRVDSDALSLPDGVQLSGNVEVETTVEAVVEWTQSYEGSEGDPCEDREFVDEQMDNRLRDMGLTGVTDWRIRSRACSHC